MQNRINYKHMWETLRRALEEVQRLHWEEMEPAMILGAMDQLEGLEVKHWEEQEEKAEAKAKPVMFEHDCGWYNPERGRR